MTYEIFEDNMPRLEKKLKTIQNKCEKYGCEFTFEITGEQFYPAKEGDGQSKGKLRYVVVEVSGKMIHNGWEFVGTIQHMSPVNVVRCYLTEVEVPARYYSAAPVCEHCNSKRTRKDTYLVRNIETGEFKQVGKSCLMEFTNGLSAEQAALCAAWYDELEASEGFSGTPLRQFYPTIDVLTYAVEAVRLYGYQKSDSESPTKSIVFEQYFEQRGFTTRVVEDGFNALREGNKEKAQAILDWVNAQTPELGSYMSSLKAICSIDDCERRSFGFVASAVAAYDRECERQEREVRQAKANSVSTWQGEIGQRINLTDVDCKLITGWDGMYGYTYIYKFIDASGNIYTWKTSNWVEDEKVSLVGTVKDHTEYKGTKQTELTRCRIAVAKK